MLKANFDDAVESAYPDDVVVCCVSLESLYMNSYFVGFQLSNIFLSSSTGGLLSFSWSYVLAASKTSSLLYPAEALLRSCSLDFERIPWRSSWICCISSPGMWRYSMLRFCCSRNSFFRDVVMPLGITFTDAIVSSFEYLCVCLLIFENIDTIVDVYDGDGDAGDDAGLPGELMLDPHPAPPPLPRMTIFLDGDVPAYSLRRRRRSPSAVSLPLLLPVGSSSWPSAEAPSPPVACPVTAAVAVVLMLLGVMMGGASVSLAVAEELSLSERSLGLSWSAMSGPSGAIAGTPWPMSQLCRRRCCFLWLHPAHPPETSSLSLTTHFPSVPTGLLVGLLDPLDTRPPPCEAPLPWAPFP